MSLLGWLNGDRTLLECVAISTTCIGVPWALLRLVLLSVERADELSQLGGAGARCIGTSWLRRVWLGLRAIVDPRDISVREVPPPMLRSNWPLRRIATPAPLEKRPQ